MRRIRFALLPVLIAAFAAAVGRAAAPPADGRAAVYWTIYNDDEHLQRETEIEALFGESFGLEEGAVTQAGRRIQLKTQLGAVLLGKQKSGDSFSSKLASALARVEDHPSPELFIAIGAHGGKARKLSTKYGDIEYAQSDVVRQIVQQLGSFKGNRKALRVNLLLSACYSGRIQRLLEMELNNNLRKTGIDLKVSLVTSAPDDKPSHGTLFDWLSEAATIQRKLKAKGVQICERCDSSEEFARIFQVVWKTNPHPHPEAAKDEPTLWSSYSKKYEAPPNVEELFEIMPFLDTLARDRAQRLALKAEGLDAAVAKRMVKGEAVSWAFARDWLLRTRLTGFKGKLLSADSPNWSGGLRNLFDLADMAREHDESELATDLLEEVIERRLQKNRPSPELDALIKKHLKSLSGSRLGPKSLEYVDRNLAAWVHEELRLYADPSGSAAAAWLLRASPRAGQKVAIDLLFSDDLKARTAAATCLSRDPEAIPELVRERYAGPLQEFDARTRAQRLIGAARALGTTRAHRQIGGIVELAVMEVAGDPTTLVKEAEDLILLILTQRPPAVTQRMYRHLFLHSGVTLYDELSRITEAKPQLADEDLARAMREILGGLQSMMKSKAVPLDVKYRTLEAIGAWMHKRAEGRRGEKGNREMRAALEPYKTFMSVADDDISKAVVAEIDAIGKVPSQQHDERANRLTDVLDLVDRLSIEHSPGVAEAMTRIEPINNGRFTNRIRAQLGQPLEQGFPMEELSKCLFSKLRQLRKGVHL